MRGSWLAYLLVMGLLAAGTWYQAEELFARRLAEVQERLNSEQAFLATLVHDLLRDGRTADIQPLVSRWGAARTDRVSLRVTAADGGELGAYRRAQPAVYSVALETDLEYMEGDRAKLRFLGDVSAVYLENTRVRVGLWLLVLLVAAVGAHLVNNRNRQKRDALRYRHLSERFLTANAELEAEAASRKRTEQALAEQRERAEVTLNSIGDAVITSDAEGRVTRINPVAERLTGWLAEEAVGRGIDEVFRVRDSAGDPIENPVHQVLRRGRVVGMGRDHVLMARGGRCARIGDTAAPIRASKGSADGVILVFWDVTEDDRMRTALVESETRFRRLVESLVDHFFMTQTAAGDVTYVSPSVVAILGYTQAEFCAGLPGFFTDHPRNTRFAECTELSLQGQRPEPFTLELRARNGDIRLLELRQVPVIDEMGGVIAAESIVHDITARRDAEAEQRLAASVFENIAEGIVVTDLDGRIQRINRAFAEITGYTAKEAIGQTPRLLSSGRQSPEFYREMWQTLKKERRWQGEMWNRNKSGKIYPEWLSISLIPDPEDGGGQRYVGVFTDIGRQKEAEEEIVRLAFHDALTGLPNRLNLMERLGNELARTRRKNDLGAILFLDLDRFKKVNDSLGHDVGDGMLKEIARRLRQSVRDYDTVARLGGDEFVVLLNAVAENREAALNRARRVAEQIRSAIVEPMNIAGHELHGSTSIGIALLPVDADNPDDALKYADKAMYRAKSTGRNGICFFTREMQDEVEQRLVLENELRRAVQGGELVLHYQPVYDLSTGRIAGLEALLRWRHPRRGILPPASFIHIAEETGIILPIGDWVLRTACAEACRWQQAGRGAIHLSVNLSVVQLRQGDVPRSVREALRETGLDPTCLELELNEGLLMENADGMAPILEELAEIGTSLSVDDFGTGYSSLGALRRFPLHKLKIDRSLVHDLPEDLDATTIAITIIRMAQNLGLGAVAEGIESHEQLEYLKRQGCDFGQGYLCGRPLLAESIPTLLSGDECPAGDRGSDMSLQGHSDDFPAKPADVREDS